MTLGLLIAGLIGYLLGAIPFGLLLTRAAGLGDVRKIGSGSIGATNVLRTGSKAAAAATVLLDGLKGYAAVILGGMLVGLPGVLAGGLAAVVGHLFPVWLGFKGGKGVATGLGVLLAANPLVGLIACLTWLLAAWLVRISSVSSLLAIVLAPVYAFALGAPPQVLWLCVAIAVLVVVRHHENISRLLAGTEPRIGAGK